ncbi:hypothetical protein JB92DRAFT_3029305 [Gautieria morchelliformis]|nr:hypothetical protein JB92DRAFT_3029305 [Gautieria morchelliformis]
MASSGDEFALYVQSPQLVPQTASNIVAGPSKRKKLPTSTDNTEKRRTPAEAIPISSDEEERPPVVAKRGKTATTPGSAANGRSFSSKAKGKAVVGGSARQRKTGGEEETAGETDADVGASRMAKSMVLSGKERDPERLHVQLARLQKNLDDVIQQRDRLSGQLDEAFQLRQNEAERLMIEQKTQYDIRLKAQDDMIKELQDSLSRADALSLSGGGTSLHFLTRETADDEKQGLQREVSKLKKTVKEKDKTIDEKDIHIKGLDEQIQLLRADLKTEIENTKALTSRNPPSSSKHNSKSAESKHGNVIRLYEELTGILITNVRHEPGQYKEEDAVYSCVQTTSNEKSLNFTLKFFQEAEEGTPSGATRGGRIIEKVIYTPQLLEREAADFVAQLDFLASPFTFQKAQMNVFTKTLTSYLEGENEENQSDASHMEVEDD